MESVVVDVVVPVQSSPPPAERSPSPPDQPQLVEAAVVDAVVPAQSSPLSAERPPSPSNQPQLVEAAVVAAQDQTPLSDHPKHGETDVVVAVH